VTAPANAARGEAEICGHILRPTFTALVAAEVELGPLFALVERAASGELKLSEMVALFWHCLADRTGILRSDLGDAVTAGGLAAATPALRVLLSQILQGR
jgi:Phage tail tube protein, GTA-gp10